MSHVDDAATLPVTWHKSSYSDSGAQCVEYGDLGETIAVRDSKDPHGPALLFPRNEVARFVAGVAAGSIGAAR